MGITAWAAGQQDTMQDHESNTPPTGPAGIHDSPISTGCRNHLPEFDEARAAAVSWSGREGGIDHWSLLELLETDGVPERFGLGHRHVDYIRAAFRKLQPSDFAAGSWPPVVWITKTKFAAKLRVSPRTVSSIEQDLARAGLIYWLDTASRRRDGRRCPRTGRILWAYGINFAPIAALADRIEAIISAAQADRIEADGLRHEIATIRCHGIITLQAAIRSGRAPAPNAEPVLAAIRSLPTAKRMASADLDALHALVTEARRLDEAVIELCETRPAHDDHAAPDTPRADLTPYAADNESNKNCTPGYPSTAGFNSNSNQYIDNNLAAASPSNRPTATSRHTAAPPWPEREDCSDGHSLEATPSNGPPAWLILDSLSPRLACHLPEYRQPTVDEFIAAANLVRSELGVSPSAWGEACRALTPVGAALAVTVIASRYDAGAVRSAGGYLRAMVGSARLGKLNLGAALWGTVDLAQRPNQPSSGTRGPSPEQPALQPPPTQEADAAEEIATQSVMTRICTGSPDPDGLEAVWRRMIARERRWPYVMDVLREYARSHPSSAPAAPLHPETGR